MLNLDRFHRGIWCRMVAGLIRRTLLALIPAIGISVLVGCGAKDEGPSAAAVQASEVQSNAAAAAWTPEMKAKYEKAAVGHQKMPGGPSKEK